MRKFIKLFTGQKGFTLIELLVVIAILGVLAAVAVPSVMGLLSSGNGSAVASNAAAIQSAADAWATKHSSQANPYTGSGGDALVTDNDLRALPTIGTYTISATGLVTYTVDGTGTITGP